MRFEVNTRSRISCHSRPFPHFYLPCVPRGKLIARLESSHRCLLILPSLRSTASLARDLFHHLQTDSEWNWDTASSSQKGRRANASIFLRKKAGAGEETLVTGPIKNRY